LNSPKTVPGQQVAHGAVAVEIDACDERRERGRLEYEKLRPRSKCRGNCTTAATFTTWV
jgi:hypothetical protein